LPKDPFIYTEAVGIRKNQPFIFCHIGGKVVKGKQLLFCVHKFQQCRTFINGKSMGVQKKKKTKPQNRYRLMWMDVKYDRNGKVVAFDDNGKAVAEQSTYCDLIKLF
jgi:beta-galactosidase